MILYHGSTVAVDHPIIIKTEQGRDFGFGFYTTDLREQAVRWARRRMRIAGRKGIYARPILSIYEFDEGAYLDLNVRSFPEPSLEWLDMVCACRSNTEYKHCYDIVTGKIANDNVGVTVSYVVSGVMRREDALERLKFEKINNQICFCTEQSLTYLKYIGFEDQGG